MSLINVKKIQVVPATSSDVETPDSSNRESFGISYNDTESYAQSNLALTVPLRFGRDTLTSIPAALHSCSSSRRESTSSIYNELIKPCTYRQTLLTMGNRTAHHLVTHRISRDEAAIMIQKHYRRYHTIRQQEEMSINTLYVRNILLSEVSERKGDWPKFISYDSDFYRNYFPDVNSELNYLVTKLEEPHVHPKLELNILHFLFSCFLKKDNESVCAHDIAILLVDIFHYNCNKNDLEGSGGIFMIPPFNDEIDFNSFYIWYTKAKSQNMFQISKFNRYMSKLFGCEYPKRFTKNFIKYRAALFDVALSLYKYDEANSYGFSCLVCKKVFYNLQYAVKHIVCCKKRHN